MFTRAVGGPGLPKRRSCETCRHLKIPCRRAGNDPLDGRCDRCARLDRQCITLPSNRKNREQMKENRIAVLENQMEALVREMREKTHARTSSSASNLGVSLPGGYPDICTGESFEFQALLAFGGGDPYAGQVLSAAWQVDIVRGGLLNVDIAREIFDRYKTKMSHRIPVVPFESDTDSEQIRKTKPVLFLSIMAVACGSVRLDLQPYLIAKISRLLADRVLFRGEKSLELIQALLVLLAFYAPPASAHQNINFSQLIHATIAMAFDLGLDRKDDQITSRSSETTLETEIQKRRCWLGCYLYSAYQAQSLKRPSLMRWSSYIEQCLQFLLESVDSLPTDKWLYHLVSAEHLMEEVILQFALDEPDLKSSLGNKTRFQLEAFVRRLQEWHLKALADGINSRLIRFRMAVLKVYIFEIALHIQPIAKRLVVPCHDEGSSASHDIRLVEDTSFHHIDMLTSCLTSIHDVFDAFLIIETDEVRLLPTMYFVWLGYAAAAFVKLSGIVSAEQLRVGSIFGVIDLRAEFYFDALLATLAPLTEGDRSTTGRKFYDMLNALKDSNLSLFLSRHAIDMTNSNLALSKSVPSNNGLTFGEEHNLPPNFPGEAHANDLADINSLLNAPILQADWLASEFPFVA